MTQDDSSAKPKWRRKGKGPWQFFTIACEVQVMPPLRRFTLQQLAMAADEYGKSRPSVAGIQHRTGMGRSTIFGHIKSLAAAGVLDIVPQAHGRKGRFADGEYQLHWDAMQALAVSGVDPCSVSEHGEGVVNPPAQPAHRVQDPNTDRVQNSNTDRVQISDSPCSDFRKPPTPPYKDDELKDDCAGAREARPDGASRATADDPAPSGQSDHWRACFEAMRKRFGRQDFDLWLAPLIVADDEGPGGRLVLWAKGRFERDQVMRRFGDRLVQILERRVVVEAVQPHERPAAKAQMEQARAAGDKQKGAKIA